MRTSPAQRRAGMIAAFKFVGIPIDEASLSPFGSDAEVKTFWPPITSKEADMAALVAIGMEEPAAQLEEIVDACRSVEHRMHFAQRALDHGHRTLAIDLGASVARICEELADKGSEDAASSLLILADQLRVMGIKDEAFARARARIAEEQR